MMKKILALAMLMVVLSGAAMAQDDARQALTEKVWGLLTEVYGYTQTEAEGFTVEVSQEDDHWAVRFYNHPGWEYTASFSLTDMGFVDAASPFRGKSSDAPENSVRSVLRAMKENGWLSNWDASSRAALLETLVNDGDISLDIELRKGLEDAAYTPSQALGDFFASCYGKELNWQPALLQWRDQIFAEFELEQAPVIATVEPGVHIRKTSDTKQVCEFAGEVPEELKAAFSHQKLQGWECLAGAYRLLLDENDTLLTYGTGLAAFEKDGRRMLVMLYKLSDKAEWQVAPVGEKALLKDRALYIAYSNSNAFDVRYPISDTAEESFRFSIHRMRDVSATIVQCILSYYTREDYETRRSIEISSRLSEAFENWYQVISVDHGNKTLTYYPALAPRAMEYIDAEAFPKTEEACQAAAEASESVPGGYGITNAVHLRGDTSSRAKDLGMLRMGTLVQVLDTLPGNPYAWYHVRLGETEGYVASIYVTYPDSVQTSVPSSTPAVAQTKKQTALKQGTGLFAKTTETLPEGTLLRVLAETGNWLMVSIPASGDDWLMRPDEAIGYVKMGDVIQAGSPIQLEWLQP